MGSDPRVLITGGSGQVGVELARLLPWAEAMPRAALDVTDESAVRKATRGRDVVVHLAAYTDVDGSERDPERAAMVNDRGTAIVAHACAEAGCYLVYVSTDYVFDGMKDGEYEEEDVPSPLNAYGRTKLAGEGHTLDVEGVVLRTSSVYGAGPNFIRTIVDLAASKRDSIEVVSDQVSRSTFAGDVARAIAWAVDERPRDVFHVAGQGEPSSRAALAADVLRFAGADTRIVPVTTEQYEAKVGAVLAPRPRNSVLALSKSQRTGVPLADQNVAVKTYVEGLL